MRTQITNLIVALVATLSISATANAQHSHDDHMERVQPPTQMYIAPPQTQNEFYFGMSIELQRTWEGTTLRIVSVTPGSPAQQAGLEIGDEIRTVNGRGFQMANDSFQAVAMMSQFVSTGGPAPAAPAVAYYVAPPTPQPIAQMIVRNVRNGQNVMVKVQPIQRSGFPAPAVAAATAAGG